MSLTNRPAARRSFRFAWCASLGLVLYLQFGVLSVLFAAETAAPGKDTSAEATELLNKMSKASKALNYDGTFVYLRGNHLDTMRIIHKAEAGGEAERLISLTGPAREVVRDKSAVTCIFPENRSVMVEKSRPHKILPTNLPQPIQQVSAFYGFSVIGHDRIAGRETRIVAIRPRDTFRYGYRLWLDDATDLLLKSDVIDSHGHALEQILFTDLKLPQSIDDALLKPTVNGYGYTWYTNEPDPADVTVDSKWTVGWLPKGFTMREKEVNAMATSRSPVYHMVFSDGIATVSVFVEKLEGKAERMEGFSSMGAVNAYSTMAGDHQITVVGEVPRITVRHMAASVKQQTNQ